MPGTGKTCERFCRIRDVADRVEAAIADIGSATTRATLQHSCGVERQRVEDSGDALPPFDARLARGFRENENDLSPTGITAGRGIQQCMTAPISAGGAVVARISTQGRQMTELYNARV